MPQPKPPHNCYVLQPKHSHDASSGLWGNRLGMVHKHHHPSYTKNTQCGGKKEKKKCVCDNKIRPRWINCDAFHYADRFLLPVQSPGAVLYSEGDPVGSIAPDKIGLSQRSRCPCANYCKFAHVKVWNLSIKPFSVLNIAFKAAPKE